MAYPLSDARLAAMLLEDAPFCDITTAGLAVGDTLATLSFRARDTICIACIEEAARLFELAGATVRRFAASGALVEPGSELLMANGPAAALHRAWKVAQVLVEVTSGIATRARRILNEARTARPGIVVACTRKYLPGAKDMMLRAIAAGGCIPHRLGLSDSVLVFAQHRALLGRKPPHLWVAQLRAAQPGRTIAVEADSLDLAMQLAHAGIDALQLDKLPPEDVARLVRDLSGMARRPLLVVTGGVTEANAAGYAAAGAELLVTSAPYAAPPADVAVRIAAA